MPQVRASVVRQLQSLGYTVSQAPDGAAGVAAFEAAAQPYDLLLTDVIMPGPLNGKALADEVARRWPETKIVFMSGYSEDVITHHGRLDAGVRLLSKPFRMNDLATTIREALDDREGQEIRAERSSKPPEAHMSDENRFDDFARISADWFWETDIDDRFRYFSVAVTRTGLVLVGRLGSRRRDGAAPATR